MKMLLIICCFMMGATPIIGDGLSTESILTLEGVWELENQQLYENDMLAETIPNENEYRQIKMYSKGRVMWTRNDPSDGNEWFAYGTYSTEGNTLKEQIEYASQPMMKIVDTTQIFMFELILKDNSFQQIQLNEDGSRSHGETYTRIE